MTVVISCDGSQFFFPFLDFEKYALQRFWGYARSCMGYFWWNSLHERFRYPICTVFLFKNFFFSSENKFFFFWRIKSLFSLLKSVIFVHKSFRICFLLYKRVIVLQFAFSLPRQKPLWGRLIYPIYLGEAFFSFCFILSLSTLFFGLGAEK